MPFYKDKESCYRQRLQNAVIRQENKHLHNALRRLGMKPDSDLADAAADLTSGPSPPVRAVNGRKHVTGCGGDYRQTLWQTQPALDRRLPGIAATTITWGASAERRRKLPPRPVPTSTTVVDDEIVRIVQEQRVRLSAVGRQRAPQKVSPLHPRPQRPVPGSTLYEQVFEKTVRGRYKSVRLPHRLKATALRASPIIDSFMSSVGVDAPRPEKVSGCEAPASSPVDWAVTRQYSHSALVLQGPPTSPVNSDYLYDPWHGAVGWSEAATRASSVRDLDPLTSASPSQDYIDRPASSRRLPADEARDKTEPEVNRDAGLSPCATPTPSDDIRGRSSSSIFALRTARTLPVPISGLRTRGVDPTDAV